MIHGTDHDHDCIQNTADLNDATSDDDDMPEWMPELDSDQESRISSSSGGREKKKSRYSLKHLINNHNINYDCIYF